ncbi:hypothetical protein MNEG_15895 [Monoraphidium neglectum]|uniref:Major facilitator superfamily (MFS) profile domain-containing protein n=1 Tax=Monoraphidium neglectum TaxID=145388 RepID=A0A0D2K7B4_9CHLO|nr:hypothetical protein MNEG_15895 [Monoraphidium neglectum]KIY92068.1 hypothetical protein MNEG_15895 [Monoraphidium neglectum]|eukprot:XP_013891088.1 hypothetical protein MNEG_15895 [Monoraphidium neglectum]
MPVCAGILLGLVVVMILQAACTLDQMMLWGWRVAFLMGALTGVVGVILRRTMPDPAMFLKRKQEVEAALERDAMEAAGGVPADDSAHVRAPALAAAKSVDDAPAPHDALPRKKKVQYHPVRNMLKNHWHSVLLQFIWEFWFAGGFYAFSSYWPSFLSKNVPGMSSTLSLGLTCANLVLTMATAWSAERLRPPAWVCGYLCDRGMSRMRAAAAGFFLAGALIAPAAVMTRAGSVALAWLAHAVFLVLVGWIGGLLAVSMCPLYPTEVRTSGMNLAHQLAVGPIGGITPVILSASSIQLG